MDKAVSPRRDLETHHVFAFCILLAALAIGAVTLAQDQVLYETASAYNHIVVSV